MNLEELEKKLEEVEFHIELLQKEQSIIRKQIKLNKALIERDLLIDRINSFYDEDYLYNKYTGDKNE
ncbi:MAG: hypothetical protein ACOCRX_03935 [Candidatus Woesearchaeota archaeon]